jgi:hypothetical protein
MRPCLVLAVLILASAPAAAQPALTLPTAAGPTPSPGYVAAGAELSADNFLNAAVDVEGGYRLADTSLGLHGLIGVGRFSGAWASSMEGDYEQVRLGLEGTRCTASGVLCGLLGVDGGLQRQHDPDLAGFGAHAALLYGRGGLTVHLAKVRLGLTFELRTGEPKVSGVTYSSGGGGLIATLGYQL